MPRMTRKVPGETRYALDAARVEKGADCWCGEAVEKLAAFENMQERFMARVRDIPGEQAALKAQGREKTVTFRELAAQKLTYQAWLELAREYGLDERE